LGKKERIENKDSSSFLKERRERHTYQKMQTSIEYTDLSGRIRIKNTPSFNHNTTLADVHQWISKWRKNPGNYYLVIKDPYEQYVDFDDEYIEDFKPFGTEESSSTTRGLVQLKIIEDNSKYTV